MVGDTRQLLENTDNLAATHTESHAETNITLAEGTTAEHLALMDGLLAALELRVPRIQAFTNSDLVYDQIARGQKL